MKFSNIIIRTLVFLLIINIVFLPTTYATGDIITSGRNFLTKGNTIGETINETALQDASSTIYKVLLSIAICASVIVGAVLGIQFIFGSAEGKAKVSETLIPYIIGCAVVFGAFTIWSFIVNFGQDVF
jgi:hypothetical protein